MGDDKGVSLLHVRLDILFPDAGLEVILGQHDHQVARLGGLGRLHDLEAVVLGLLPAGRSFSQAHDHLTAAVLAVEGVRPPLAAVADDRDGPVLELVQVCVCVVENFQIFQKIFRIHHGSRPSKYPENEIPDARASRAAQHRAAG